MNTTRLYVAGLWTLLLSALLSAALAGCGDDSSPTDGGVDSGTFMDGGRTDSSGGDSGSPSDSGTRDSGPRDAGPPPPPTACAYAAPTGHVVYVATDGDDDAGDGTMGSPWATITHALDSVADGTTILVRPGTYSGRVRMRGSFAAGVTVRSEVPYMAKLRHSGTVLTFFTDSRGCNGITVEGFDIAHDGAGAGALVVQLDGDGRGAVHDITLRNNVLHDSFNNDILKINNGSTDITVERNMFFNQTGQDEHIDINSVRNVVVQDNVFFNDFEASGRSNGNDTSSYIVVKDSNGTTDMFTGSQAITIRRNVFLHYEGSTGTGFLLFGEDGKPFYEVSGALVENNLFLGDSSVLMRSPYGVKGCESITFRNNTVAGDLPSRAFALRFNLEGENLAIRGSVLTNNLWSDPTGTMGAIDASDANDFSDAHPASAIDGFTLDHNLYYNGGAAIPEDASESINPSDDANAVMGDPGLGSQAALVVPHFDGSTFADGSADICEAFTRLVTLYGTPSDTSPGVDAADPSTSAADDILGRPRGASPDLGAVELP